ncbi:MAG: DUF459 domain-containing protein [Nannocystis sp.]|nr:DUF459 domain-containing protein [Nannocystis sp.]
MRALRCRSIFVLVGLTFAFGCAPDKKAPPGAGPVALPPTAIVAPAEAAPADLPEVVEAPAVAEAPEVVAEAAGAKPGVEPEAVRDPPQAAELGPFRVLILGDSLAATGFGALLERRLDEHPSIECFRKAKSASGLARPDFFDWMSEAKTQVKSRDPHLVVVIMGGNDGQDLISKSGAAKRVQWSSEKWDSAYRERISAFVTELRGEGRKVLWLGLPKMGMASFEKKLELIRDVQQAALADFAEVEYLDTIQYFVDRDGNLQDRADVGKRKNQALRADDGIHFTMAGSEYFADKVYPEVLRLIGVSDAT